MSEALRAEITERLGSFLPFFEPALNDPGLLESMWRQTVAYYLEGPLPFLFKERVAALLARECGTRYCLVCHVCTLRPLGMTAEEVQQMLLDRKFELRPPALVTLRAEEPLGEEWPAVGTLLEDALLQAALHLYRDPRDPAYHKEMLRILGRDRYHYLAFFLDYCKMCMEWADRHPSISYQADPRVRSELGPLLDAAPRLKAFFADFGIHVGRE